MSTQFDEFSGALPLALMLRAYRTSDGNELAWTRSDAIEAITGLESAGFTLLGVEVWIPSSPGPLMTGRWWDLYDRGVPNRRQSAVDFVTTFAWGQYDDGLKDQEPYFNLTVAEKGN
jgi:hypothetical protein